VLMYAFFGVFGIVYLVGLGVMALRTKVSRAIAEPTLSVIGYFLIYGVVLSILEDQVAALAIGAGIGALWQRRYAQDWSLPAVRMQAPRRMQTGLAAPAYAGRRP
jgi:hypothetical protein